MSNIEPLLLAATAHFVMSWSCSSSGLGSVWSFHILMELDDFLSWVHFLASCCCPLTRAPLKAVYRTSTNHASIRSGLPQESCQSHLDGFIWEWDRQALTNQLDAQCGMLEIDFFQLLCGTHEGPQYPWRDQLTQVLSKH